MVACELVAFDPVHAATVASWPASAVECVWWCGRMDFPLAPGVVAAWSDEPGVRAHLLVRDGVLVGYGELWCDDEEAELARLIVAPAVRGQGMGRRLVDELVRVGRETGVPLILLRVHPDNRRAIRLYLGLGFRRQAAATEADWNVGQPQPYRWFVR